MRYFLDTSFVIDYLRSDPAAIARFDRLSAEGDEIFVNEIVVCEAATGSRLDPDPDLAALLEPLEFIPPTATAALLAGRWRRDALSTGRTLSLADALIAAAAETSSAAVLTRNVRDFALTQVRVESY